MPSTRRQAIAAALALGVACATGPARAESSYPSKPITLVVAYPAGGDTDALARLFAEKLSARVGQPVVVDNRPGASGIIGSAYVSKAQPDGYTLLLSPSTFSIAQLVLKTGGTSGYDVLNGFTPIVQTGSQPLFLVAGGASGLASAKDLVAAAKGGKPLTFASPGSGSPMHILGEMFNRAAGMSLGHVPYKGVAPAVNDVLGGHVPATFITLGPVAPYLANGKMLPLAVASHERSALAPKVPTLQELGYKDVEVTAWNGLWGPRNLPPEIVKTLNAHFNEILKMPEIVSRMAVLGTTPVGGSADVLGKTNAADFARFGKVIKELGIQAD